MSSNNKQHINDIIKNYKRMEEEFITQLNYEVNNHYVTAGGNREEIWKSFFERIVPKKFNIARSVFLIDSNGKISREVDIAIYDEQYTPYVFNYGLIKFIPIEAVSAVVQCKSKCLCKDVLNDWVESIDALKTSNNSVVRLATYVHIGEDNDSSSQRSTKPINILCYISNKKTRTDTDKFDIVIKAFSKDEKNEEKDETVIKKWRLNLTIIIY